MRHSCRLSTFDRTDRLVTAADRPEGYEALNKLVAREKTVIARGAGLSYSAASFGLETLSVDMTRFDRVLAYEPNTGMITVEPGLRVGDLLAVLAAKSRHLPALPGYPEITVGGCVAFDVHGKSQYHTGNFGDWVEEFRVLHPEHGEIACSRNSEREIFELTIGGLGLTGIITQVTLRTAALNGIGIQTSCVRARDLVEAADIMRAHSAEVDTLYSWNNMNLRGRGFGRGVVFLEKFVAVPKMAVARTRRLFGIRSQLPLRIWTRTLTNLVLRLYERAQPVGKPRVSGLHASAFPIEGKEVYYAAFGRLGFREYQMIVPFQRWVAFVEALARVFEQARVPVTLGSLKLFKGTGRLLRFRGEGICLAIDVPAIAASLGLFSELDRLALAMEARANLSKDSRMGAATCEAMFGEYAEFRSTLRRFDPNRRCQSRLRGLIGV